MPTLADIRIGDNPPISPLGIGTWAWGDKLMWGYGQGYSTPELEAAFTAAVDAGVRLFDTAELYGRGRSEELLGRFISKSGAQVQVASKFFPYPWRLTKGQFTTALRSSLKRLGLERLELYQLHWPFPPRTLEFWAEALAEAQARGLIGAIGISNCDLKQMERVVKALEPHGLTLASNQVEYSLIVRKPETSGLLKACQERGIILIAYSPLGQGMLTGKYGPDKPLPGMRGRRHNRKLPKLVPLVQALREVAESRGKTPAQIALNWAMGKGALVIPGAKNARQAEQNAGALGWRLSEEEMARLEALSSRVA
jgi:aryl-alcohol dehydrogenase-like predicted oxidoreductase